MSNFANWRSRINKHAFISKTYLLTSTEMITLSWLLSILHISVFMPFRFLAGKCHEFKKYQFGAADMGCVMTLCMKNSTWSKTNLSWFWILSSWMISSKSMTTIYHLLPSTGIWCLRRNKWRLWQGRMVLRSCITADCVSICLIQQERQTRGHQ